MAGQGDVGSGGKGGGGRFFALMCALGAFAILSSTMSKNPVLPLFAQSLGVGGAELGLIAAASTIPGIIISLPAGSLSDIFGRRRVIMASLLVFASAPFLYLLVSAAWQLALVRFYHGFATAVFGPVANAVIAERYPAQRGERISTFSSATIVGRSVAPFLGGAILYVANFRSVYLAVGIAAVTALLIGTRIPRDLGAGSGRKSLDARRSLFRGVTSSWRGLASDHRVLVTSLVEAVQYLTYGSFEFFLVLFAKSLGMNDFLIGVVSGVQLVSVVVTKPFMGRLSDRMGRRPVIVGGLLIGGAPLLLSSFASGFAGLALVSVLYGLGFSVVTSSTAAYVADLTSREIYGSAMGFLSTIMDVGQALGPVVTGIAVAAFGFVLAFQSLGFLLFAVAGVFAASSLVARRVSSS
jgi:MFS family permease